MLTRLPALLLVFALSGCNLFVAVGEDEGELDLGETADTSEQDLGSDLVVEDMTSTPDNGPDLSDMGIEDMPTDVGDMPDMLSDMAPDLPPDMSTNDPCDWPDTIFCDGYEASGFAAWDTVYETDTIVTWENTIVNTGVGSMKVELIAGTGQGGTVVQMPEAIDNGETVWMRYAVYVPSGQTWLALEVASLYSNDEDVNSTIAPSRLDIHVHPGAARADTSFSFPEDQWVCVELELKTSEKPNEANGEFKGWIDGSKVMEASDLDWTLLSPMDGLAVGIDYSPSTQLPVELYFDDVFVGRSRPGCP